MLPKSKSVGGVKDPSKFGLDWCWDGARLVLAWPEGEEIFKSGKSSSLLLFPSLLIFSSFSRVSELKHGADPASSVPASAEPASVAR